MLHEATHHTFYWIFWKKKKKVTLIGAKVCQWLFMSLKRWNISLSVLLHLTFLIFDQLMVIAHDATLKGQIKKGLLSLLQLRDKLEKPIHIYISLFWET